MTKKIKIADLPEFDMAEHLPDEQAIAEYLTVVLEEDDPAALADALGAIARSRGMSDIAKASGITREALYKALRAPMPALASRPSARFARRSVSAWWPSRFTRTRRRFCYTAL